MRRISCRIACSSLAILVAAGFLSYGAHAQILVHFDLPAQSLAQSLKAIGTATNTDVGFSASQVAGFVAPPLKADLTVDSALARVLIGTGLQPKYLNDHAIVIAAGDSFTSVTADRKTLLMTASAAVEADGQVVPPQTEAAADSTDNSSSLNGRKRDLEEIVVTGTHIRGVESTASPTEVYTREDIDRTGLGTVAAFIAALPQNFNSASENTIGAVAGGGTASGVNNGVGATAINLRGLGNDATLVLIDGRRLAPGGESGNISDISLIPLNAVERVEIVTDGASAIYGSDAVGGVVNFILRRDYDGAETRLRYGTVSDGGSHETQVGQNFGKTWNTGSALLSYEYYDRTPLSALDRSYSNTVAPPFSLLPEQVRQGLLADIRQKLTDGIQLFGQGLFSHRSTYADATDPTPDRSNAEITSFTSTLGARGAVTERSALEISASYARSKTDERGELAGVPSTYSTIITDALSLDAKLDGTIGTIPGGDVSYAGGGQFRRETYDFAQRNVGSTVTAFADGRNVAAGYIELRIPLVGARTSSTGAKTLELTLADRYEHYDDFGASNNPQAGIIWSPVASLKIRGTIGTSFKAPLLSDLNPIPTSVFAIPVVDPREGSQSCSVIAPTNNCTNVLEIAGGNPALTPEKARTWTVGFDWKPLDVDGLKVDATYYNILFTDRIVSAGSEVSIFDTFRLESTLGPSIVQRNPSLALVQQLAAYPSYANFFGIALTNFGAILDIRLKNLSSVRTDGIDLGASYKTSLLTGEFETGVNATYILKFDDQFTPSAPQLKTLNTPYNPIDFRARARAEFQKNQMRFSTFLNYVNSYTDNQSGLTTPVASWTTVDANVQYMFGEESKLLSHSAVMLGVTNLANRSPPFLSNTNFFAVNFDGINANALGRYWYVQLSKQW